MHPLVKKEETKEQNIIDKFLSKLPEFDFTVPFSFRSLFGPTSFIFWLILAIIFCMPFYILFSKFNLIEKLGYYVIVLLIIMIMFFWTFLSVNIKKNIMVFKVTIEGEENRKQIIFKKEKIDKPTNKQINNKIEEQLNFITRPNDDSESFNKESVKEVFEDIFLKSLDEVNIDNSEDDPIEGPYIYNSEAHVYYINIKTNKPLLTGLARLENNYRPKSEKELLDHYKQRGNRRREYKYNDNIFPILFELKPDFLTEKKEL
tara:strand:- start:960 stop:1739 length:780 start_codon:yes stop_codon:yes gene_type:complete